MTDKSIVDDFACAAGQHRYEEADVPFRTQSDVKILQCMWCGFSPFQQTIDVMHQLDGTIEMQRKGAELGHSSG